MAELLVLAFDTHNKDPERDVHAYKKGHVISIQPDGHTWGKQEGLPKFHVVKLPGVKLEDVQKYLEPKVDLLSVGEERKHIGIRKYKLDVEKLSAESKTALEKDGVVTMARVADLDEKMVNG